MKAIHSLKGGDPSVLELTEISKPTLDNSPTSILIKVHAVSVNPVDYKQRTANTTPGRILGFDCAGIVEEVGSKATLFKKGDYVMSSSVLGKPGTNAEYFVIEEDLVGRMPKGWSFADAAALPLVSITAWELIYGAFHLRPADSSNDGVLIINGAGGVGSIAIQLCRRYFKLKDVIVTASRPETVDWVKNQGATQVLNHRKDIVEEMGGQKVKYSMLLHSTLPYLEAVCKVMKSRGHVGSIVRAEGPLPFQQDPFAKCLSFHWEYMLLKNDDPPEQTQGQILNIIADLADQGIVTPITSEKTILTAPNLRSAHAKLEAGKAIGKIVLTVEDGAFTQ